MRKISRRKTIEGTSIPGVIWNANFHYANIDVYEDGMINCWELVDLDGVKEKIKVKWLVPQIPIGQNISIFHLGTYKIECALWNFNEKSYYEFIKNTVKQLNPKLSNIYKISREEKELLEKRRVSYSPQATDFYVEQEVFYETIDGKGFTIFVKDNNKNYLANVIIYEDGQVRCYSHEFEKVYDIESVRELFENGTFFTNFKNPTSVILDRLGEVKFSEVIYATDINEKYKELINIHKELNGEKTDLEKCRNVYCEYLKEPSEALRDELKRMYELIPEHERIYLGDMDSRDLDYIRIIYRPNEKREV